MKVVFLLSIAIFAIVANLNGQSLDKPELAIPDSSETNYNKLLPELNEPRFDLYSGLLVSSGTIDYGIQWQEWPKIDFNQRLFNFLQDYSFSISERDGSNMFPGSSANRPFLFSGTIFNQAAYKISNRLTIGGNSYGYNDIFSAPLLNDLNQYNSRGASMFFQYKVSKNIKIETRVSVNGNQF